MKKLIFFLISLVFFINFLYSDDFPQVTSWVNDFVGILNYEEKQDLEKILQEFEKETSTQIFVAIMNSVPENYEMEDYVNRLFAKWNPGEKEKNNGVLLAIFLNDRKIRIEVGYGLEGALTDAISKRIIVNDIAPYFKEGRYYDGIYHGIKSIISVTKGEYKATKKKSSNKSSIIFFIILFIILKLLFKSRRGYYVGRGGGGGGFWISVGSSGWNSSSRGGGFSGFSGGGGGLSGGGGASGSW